YDVIEHRLLIPRYDYDGLTVLTHNARRMPDSNGYEANDDECTKYKKAFNNSFVHDAPLGFQTLKRQGAVILTEGDFDYFMFEKSGYPCLGKIPENYWPEIISKIENRECVLAYDTDKVGQGFTEKAIAELFKHGIKFSVANLPEQVKDVNDFVVNGGNVKELIENATDGLEYIALSFKPKETDSKAQRKTLEKGLKDFLIQAKKQGVDDADLQSLYDRLVQHGFSAEWLKAVKKKADGGESENEIVEALINQYDFLFNEKTGFYVYDKSDGIWQQKDDSFIKKSVKKYLGAVASSKKLYAITEHIKAATVSKIPIEKFNKNPIFGFKNKTLHFKGQVLKDFDISDYLTHRVDYDFDANATCDEWLKTVSLIFANDEKRVACFQEFCGYCLITHCKYEKALILRDKGGNGSNGKSTLLKVLIFVFGKENCTSLQPYQFGDKFSIIHLKDSKVNICTDCNNDIQDAVSNLKLAISGETLNGCYKNKDFVQFEPVAKIIFAINGGFNVAKSLINGALKRRFLVIDCPVQFIDKGEEDSYHIKNDKNMAEKLMKEKAGIFNWCLAGAKRLIENGGNFTETDEQAELDAMFITENESVNDFVDFMLEDESAWKKQDFKLSDMFANYAEFCADKDFEEILSDRKFYGFFEARLKSKGVQFKKWQPHGESRHYMF
ncbi:MAG: toprim domain-containing protein, partial [Synergistaceae bacterium]|nr:toprim domain-containing protein [Synergistaceae bacterium]